MTHTFTLDLNTRGNKWIAKYESPNPHYNRAASAKKPCKAMKRLLGVLKAEKIKFHSVVKEQNDKKTFVPECKETITAARAIEMLTGEKQTWNVEIPKNEASAEELKEAENAAKAFRKAAKKIENGDEEKPEPVVKSGKKKKKSASKAKAEKTEEIKIRKSGNKLAKEKKSKSRK